jgi:hypothetical protein
MVTSGIEALGETTMAAVIEAVQRFDQFDANNDPHHEHDFGAIEIAGETVFFKIDYYDRSLEAGSPDPADEAVTQRVLTIMLASEY